MCRVESGHAERIKELFAYPNTIFHSGTNAIQAEYILARLKEFGLAIPPQRLFLSYEQGCEYKRMEGKPTLINKIYETLNLKNDDQVLLIQGSKDKIPPIFEAVAIERYDDSAKIATELFSGTQVLSWNNLATDAHGQPISLINYLENNRFLKKPDLSLSASVLQSMPSFVNSLRDTGLTLGRHQPDPTAPTLSPVAQYRPK